ncbi:sensor domain-containing diguanylate cyclase [Luteimonas yindakuii]|uniref:sensor domain-containing diguanylate cyclase n=1 Tax=Luteimonas yindakuii TaxID=2565782 RepID=UPI00140E374F|nr:sensor domain-containing diguanylate cyclase [Luteimonas yindakuii]
MLAVLIATAAWLALTLARGPGELAAIWVGNGILTGWLLSRRTATWPGYVAIAFAAELPARLLAGDAPAYAAAIALCNLVEVLAVAAVVRSRVPDIRNPRHWMRLGGIAIAATLVACAVAGAMAASVAHGLHGQPWGRAFASWYAAHVVGMVVVATTTLVVQRERLRLFTAQGRGWSLAATMGLLVAVATGVFLTPYPLLFLAYPALLLVAARHQFVGVALGVIALGLIGAGATHLGYGPLWLHDLDDHGRIALLQLYLAGGCLMTIPLCLAMAERQRLAASLRESERRYRMLADHSHDAIARVRADGERLYVSPSSAEMFGWSPAELLGSRWDIVHPDDRAQQQQAMAEVLATGRARTDVFRVRHRDGHYVWIEAVSRRIPADDGGDSGDLMLAARDISRRVAVEQALEESRRELERLARADALTGLANRREFDARLAQALRRLQRHGTPVALLCMDIDHFKRINDGHGHACGDAVLQLFARRLCDAVRGTDLVARLGGDEFTILVEDAAPGSAEAVARKIVAASAQPVDVDATPLVVTTSIGIAYALEPVDAVTFMARADAALYAAKDAGRNGYRVHVQG